ncbi:hypothetical protein [Ensifer adhaerens]|uniref:hypothetical protein n=1 Tax=Ensifer adhaerens TaxID=106592 RepID=UPI001569E1D6|nr:hypothetical protein [Ensifer adhaerens]
MQNDNRSQTRKAISLALGAAMALAGAAGFLWMFFFVVEPVKIMIWMAPIGVMATGIAILYDDLRKS